MRIDAVCANTNVCYMQPKVQTCRENVNKVRVLQQDTVSFGAIKGVQISKRVIDYGDIFVEGAKLINENLKRTKKVGAYLANADLSGSDLQKSSLFGAMFDNANLTGTSFHDSNLAAARFSNTITRNTNLSHCNFYNAIFEGDKFGPWTNLQGSNIWSADFRNADMKTLNLTRALYDVDTRFPAGFDPTEFQMYYIEKGADFSGISSDLEYTKLRYNAFENMNFSNSSLKRADMKNSKFENCNMHNTILKRAYAKDSIFIDVDMSNADLKQTVLTNAVLINVDLRKANLKSAFLDWKEIRNVDLRGAKYNSETVFKEGFEPKAVGMLFEDTELVNKRDKW